jgi:pimeloyl-ACP methyl ester carboxylesterase
MTVSAHASRTRTVYLRGGLTITVNEYGTASDGTAVLVLHGGAGPRSVAAFAAALSEHAYVIVPTHPGFEGTPRPESTDSVADLAVAYLDLIEELGLNAVLVIGSSIGGWIATEMGLQDNHGRISGLILLSSVGIKPEPPLEIVDTGTISPAEFFRIAYNNPYLRPDPAALSNEQWDTIAANQRTVAVYAGAPYMHDPKLCHRLHRVTVPVLVVWGKQDGIVPLEYGRAFANAFPRAHFEAINNAGHFPHMDQPGAVFEAIGDFVATEIKPGES